MLITLPRSNTPQGIAYYRSGQGQPVVCIHGVGLRAESWFQQMDALAVNYEVFALDMPGHGSSAPINAASPNLDDYIDRISQCIIELIGRPAVIIGHSMGALIAIEYAARHPNHCLAVVAMNAVYRRTEATRAAVLARAKELSNNTNTDVSTNPVSRWFDQNADNYCSDMADLCVQWLRQADVQGYAAAYTVFAESDGPTESSMAALTMPSLFVTGSEDYNSSPDMSRAMAEKAVHGEVYIVDQARHMMLLTHPKEINQLLQRYIQQATATATPHHKTSLDSKRMEETL